MADAVVVGAGPNGLAGALTLAQAGLRVTVLEAQATIGGGARSSTSVLPDLVVDHCAAIHPLAVRSPFMRRAGLERYGLRWRWPEIDASHPLDGGLGVDLHTSVHRTAHGLGPDSLRWLWAHRGPAADFDDLQSDVMRPLSWPPSQPLRMARFGLPALSPATVYGRLFATPRARALFAGVAAHAMRPLEHPLSASVGLGLLTAAHSNGWPVVEGGTGRLVAAMAAALTELGGRIETATPVERWSDLPSADIVLLDLTPDTAARILRGRLHPRVQRAYERQRRGPGVHKVDFAVEEGVPWAYEPARRAGTVHLGGSAEEIATTERAVAAGRMPERPFVLVGQQYLADPGRSAGNVHPVYAYAHVPHAYPGDATSAVMAQIERFAPGFRARVVASVSTPPETFHSRNANFTGGDILSGAETPARLIFGPRPALNPYATGIPGVYLCSATTPPGPGAHGMCGHHAARSALRALDRRTTPHGR
ncbi:NAD(P)/FAD-dependent oxidoreductase [Spiractinospora alimapuensis]|uniref:phytoene desaturase family protein n=1 Tax=Spiractinospora alimapuensis TaxID=2820884 RepID=UPI001F43869A|nr:NAD(P)/FAD-dependent oxidoreductase [Spiractinospora alimapuensis]QVQ50884.1 NAD(P)/FAD-dependent oxidoreductase [Spiractinospora alimapuensis]